MTSQNQPDPQSDELNQILYEHCEDLTDVQHIRLREAIEAWGRKQSLEELEGIARVYNSLPELAKARENTCISLFARIRQLKAELQGGKND